MLHASPVRSLSLLAVVACSTSAALAQCTANLTSAALDANWVVESMVAMRDGSLVAGGWFTSVGGVAASLVARRVGGQWQPLGSGLSGPQFASVQAVLQRSNGDLVVGGAFDLAGGVLCHNIARWNGSTWSPMGAGLQGLSGTQPYLGQVFCLVELPNGDLIAGGAFQVSGSVALTNVARWNGLSWTPLGNTTTNPPVALAAMPNGNVVGAFIGSGPLVWNGLWWGYLGTPFPAGSNVEDLLVLPNGDLLAAGTFSAAGGVPATNIARWNGSSWSPLGAGLPWTITKLQRLPNGHILAFGLYRIDRWDGQAWSQQAATSTVLATATQATVLWPNGDIEVGGGFLGPIGTTGPYLTILSTTCPAGAAVVPTACQRPAGPLALDAPTRAWLGGTAVTRCQPFAATAFGILVTGFTPVQVPLSVVDPSAGINCELLVAPDLLAGMLPAGGVGSLSLPIPSDPALLGGSYRQQVVELVPGAGSLAGVFASNALVLTIGSW